VVVAFAVAMLLRFAPNVAVPFQWPLVGGFVFAIGWVIATAVFALYVANFASYSNTYGALGGVVVLMLWFYLTAVLLLLAAEVTSLLVKDHAPEGIEARQREIQGRHR
jgi:membrane protein